jgi:hypothetical protein
MREVYHYEEVYNILREHYERRRKNNDKSENIYDYIDIKESDIMLLCVKYFIRHNGSEIQKIDGVDRIVNNPWDILDVIIALPRFVDKYYLRLNGNMYSTTFQIVDGSTYNNANIGGKNKKAPCDSFKTLFTPIRVTKLYSDLPDFNNKSVVRHTMYSSTIFGNRTNCMYYILANFGLYGTFQFLDINCISIKNAPVYDSRYYCIDINGVYICYPKLCANDPMVQALVVAIYDAIRIRKETFVFSDVFDIRFWIKNLGFAYGKDEIDKGLFILNSMDGSYDIITREELHLPENLKANIYQILRWMMREFKYLYNKNNVDVTIKRLRHAEYFAHMYAMKVNNSLYVLSDSGKKVTLQMIRRRLYTAPMYIINQISNNSNLIAYRDVPNDNDAITALKYTLKGISGLGESGKVQESYRFVDPSHIGILELDSSTTSDPGMSGTLCPLGNLYSNEGTTSNCGSYSFSNYQEPNFWNEKYKKYQTDFIKEDRPNLQPVLFFDKDQEPECFEYRQKIINESLEIDKVVCPFYDINTGEKYSNVVQQLHKELENDANIKSLFELNGITVDELQ